jgi:hypothetical protein
VRGGGSFYWGQTTAGFVITGSYLELILFDPSIQIAPVEMYATADAYNRQFTLKDKVLHRLFGPAQINRRCASSAFSFAATSSATA